MTQLHYTLSEIPEIARMVLKETKTRILLFYGDLGVGKTTLIKEMVKQLGSCDTVSSPTFSLVNEYATTKGPVYHFDFYRIEDEIEALDMGIEEYFAQDTYIFIEWPEKITSFLPAEAQEIKLTREKGQNVITF